MSRQESIGSAIPIVEESAPKDAPLLRSEDLLSGSREVFIQHGAETYRLMVTRNGKLILQK